MNDCNKHHRTHISSRMHWILLSPYSCCHHQQQRLCIFELCINTYQQLRLVWLALILSHIYLRKWDATCQIGYTYEKQWDWYFEQNDFTSFYQSQFIISSKHYTGDFLFLTSGHLRFGFFGWLCSILHYPFKSLATDSSKLSCYFWYSSGYDGMFFLMFIVIKFKSTSLVKEDVLREVLAPTVFTFIFEFINSWSRLY